MEQVKSAIITGASSGIGMETAYALAARGYALALAARREDRLREVAAGCEAILQRQGHSAQQAASKVRVIPTDVGQSDQVQALVRRTHEEFGRIDVMVNNAGYGLFARVDETSESDMRRIFDVNYFGVFHGCREVAPIMKAQGGGHIFNVSSVVGRRGTPFHGAYCATKFAIVGLSDSLRVELRPHRVHVTTVLPALTATEFFTSSRRARDAGRSFSQFKSLTPASVVGRKIAATVGKGRPEIVFTLGGKLLVQISVLSPRLTDWMMGSYFRDLQRRLNAKDAPPQGLSSQ